MWDFPRQGLNPCPLHWQVDSYPLGHQGSPSGTFPIQVCCWLSRGWLGTPSYRWPQRLRAELTRMAHRTLRQFTPVATRCSTQTPTQWHTHAALGQTRLQPVLVVLADSQGCQRVTLHNSGAHTYWWAYRHPHTYPGLSVPVTKGCVSVHYFQVSWEGSDDIFSEFTKFTI